MWDTVLHVCLLECTRIVCGTLYCTCVYWNAHVLYVGHCTARVFIGMHTYCMWDTVLRVRWNAHVLYYMFSQLHFFIQHPVFYLVPNIACCVAPICQCNENQLLTVITLQWRGPPLFWTPSGQSNVSYLE